MVRLRLATWSRSPLTWAAVCTLVLVAYAGLSLALPETTGMRTFGLMGAVFTRGCAAAASLLMSGRVRTAEEGRAWRLLAISFTFWVAADSIQAAAYISIGRLLDQPSVADLLRLAGFLSAIPALGSYPALPAERFSRIRETLDVAILSLAVSALAWLIVIRSVIDLGIAGPIQAFWASLSPFAHLVLAVLAARLILLSASTTDRLSFSILGFSFVLLAGMELGSGYTRLIDSTQGLPPSAGGRMLAGLMMLLAVVILEGSPELASQPQPGRRGNLLSRVETILPIALTYMVLGSVAYDWRLSGRLDAVGIAAAGLLSLLLVARQGVIVGQVEFRQYAALVHTSADMAFVARSDGRLILHNPALMENLDADGRFDRELTISDFVIPEQSLEEVLGKAKDAGWSGEVHFRRSDSTTLPVYLSLRPVYDERRSRPLLAATAHDLTRIKDREEELRQALNEVAAARSDLEGLNLELERKVEDRTGQLEQMVRDLYRLNQDLKELDRLKTEFVALVSHELRAPLTNIQTGVELILTSYPRLKRGAQESLELVQAETIRLTEFVETILDLSALEAGRFHLQLAPLDLSAVAKTVADRFFDKAARDLLEMEFPPDLPPIDADRRAVSSVLFHLLDNALKYAPGQTIVVSAQAEGDSLAVSVTDHGPGVPEAERERVFEMFHRLDASDSREVYGHGLGLHLVRRLVEAMGGDVRIEEPEGGGTKIIFRIPRARS